MISQGSRAVRPGIFPLPYAQRASDFTVCCDRSRAEPNFSDTSESSPRDVLPENHENPSSLTAKHGAHQPRRHSVRASKPMRLYPDRRIGADCCYNRHHIWDNKRNCLASRAVSLRLKALPRQRLLSRSARQRCLRTRSVPPAVQHSKRFQLCWF
jgi:hypothetical protein